MTTELTDEQIREAAMKASRLEVERAPIASTELSDAALCQALNDVCRTFHKGEEHKCIGSLAADRLAERNETLERVKDLGVTLWSTTDRNFADWIKARLDDILAPAQKEAAVEKQCLRPVEWKEVGHLGQCAVEAQPSSPDAAPDEQRCPHGYVRYWDCSRCIRDAATKPSSPSANIYGGTLK